VALHRSYPRAFWALCAGRLANQVGAFSLAFLTLLMTQRGHLTVPQAGVVMAAFSLATFPSRILGGWLADAWSRRGAIVLGLMLTATAQLALFEFTRVAVLIGAAVFLGLAFEIYEPGSDALVVDSTSGGNRSAAYSVLSVWMQVGSVVAGLLAAVLAGFGVRWLFLADAVSCLVAAGIIALLAGPGTSRQSGAAGRARSRVADRRLLRLTMLACLYATCYMALLSVLPLTIVRRHVPASGLGIVLAVSSLTGICVLPLAIRLLGGVPDRLVLSWSYAVMAAGFALTGLSRSLAEFIGSAVIWTVGSAIALGRARAVVSEGINAGDTASAMALYGLSWSVGGIAAPVTGTLLLAHAGPAWTWTAFALALAILAPAANLAAATRPSPAGDSPGEFSPTVDQ
jgi:MFS family permease